MGTLWNKFRLNTKNHHHSLEQDLTHYGRFEQFLYFQRIIEETAAAAWSKGDCSKPKALNVCPSPRQVCQALDSFLRMREENKEI
ncbi:Coiled-Coil Domain-Containing Protein 13 [Manis pentadactyla]|nr:Coiled-Coil Domain-Containing Protein 13 [Manis pentadactyla]